MIIQRFYLVPHIYPYCSNATQAPRKSHTRQSTPQKYCSDRCRRERPRSASSAEDDIERAFVRLLGNYGERRVVKCEEVESVVFTKTEPDGLHSKEGELPASDRLGVGDQSDGEEEADDDDGGGVRLPSSMEPPAVESSKKSMSEGRPRPTAKKWGMQKAKEREMVRRAARRGVAFGFEIEEGNRRSVEAVQRGRVVECSFAKGEWGVRWRD